RATLRLYQTTFENPLPEVPIATVDFISPLTQANLLLFGLTIDNDARPLAISYGPGEVPVDAPVFDTITFTLQNAAGQPAPGAALAWTAQGPRIPIDFPPFAADERGEETIEVPRRSIRRIQY